MNMLIGGSCGGRYSRPIAGITCYENRILQNNEHKHFWADSKFCIDNNIYLIVNIDTYLTHNRWRPTNQELRDFTIQTKNKLKLLGATRFNCRFSVDNESDEYASFDYYMNMVRVIHDALAGEFELGAGNFRTPMYGWYNELALNHSKYFEVLDVHMQDGLSSKRDIDNYCNWLSDLKRTRNVRIAVTEGNNFYDVTTSRGHDLLKYQIERVSRVGCETFCFVYVNWDYNNEESHENMTYNVNSKPVSPYWNDMVSLINKYKPAYKEHKEEILDMKLKLLRVGSKGSQVVWLQKILEEEYGFKNAGGADGIFGALTDRQVKDYQRANNLAVDGIVGKDTTFELIVNATNFTTNYWLTMLKIYMAFE